MGIVGSCCCPARCAATHRCRARSHWRALRGSVGSRPSQAFRCPKPQFRWPGACRSGAAVQPAPSRHCAAAGKAAQGIERLVQGYTLVIHPSTRAAAVGRAGRRTVRAQPAGRRAAPVHEECVRYRESAPAGSAPAISAPPAINGVRFRGFSSAVVCCIDWLNPQPTAACDNRQKRPRLCKNAAAVLRSGLLLEICQRVANQQTRNLRRGAICVLTLPHKPAQKSFTPPRPIAVTQMFLRNPGRFTLSEDKYDNLIDLLTELEALDSSLKP